MYPGNNQATNGVDLSQGNPEEPMLVLDENSLLQALANRKRRSLEVILTDQEKMDLGQRVVNDFVDAQNANGAFKQNHLDFLNNWRQTPELPADSHPLGDLAANVKTPLTTTYIEQWKSRLAKVVLGDGNIAKFYSLVDKLEDDELTRISKWFNWELVNVVKIDKVLEDIFHYCLIDGICISSPCYKRETKRIVSSREFDLRDDVPVSTQVEIGIKQCFSTLGYKVNQIQLTSDIARFLVDIEEFDTLAEVTVLSDNGALVFELEYDCVVEDGVEVTIPDSEDIVVMNVSPDLKKLPFFGIRTWFTAPGFREMYDRGELIRGLTEEDVEKIIAMSDSKTSDFISQQNSRDLDLIEGADSLGESSAYGTGVSDDRDSRTWIEIYRWEGDITYKRERIGVVAWIAARAQQIIKLQRRESITKDGSLTCLKHDFIPVPGRFYSIGMCELLRHVQTEMDGIHNFRLNSALVATVPFGFYAPAAGAPASIIGLKPGSLYPVKDPTQIVFPKLGWNQIWGFEEESLVRKYASELAGMGDSGVGTYTSKRTSASEFLGTTQALDLRTEYIARGILRQVEELFYRIFSLYQQHSKGERVFLIAGLDNKDLVDRLSMDRLQGRLKLQLTGSVRQLSQQIEKETAMQMMSVLLNQFAVSLGIVGPDTVYAAIQKVMEASNYKGVPIHKPKVEEDSPPPMDEVAMMNAGILPEPHLGEDFNMHMQSHMLLASRPDLDKLMSPEGQVLLQQHIKATVDLWQQVQIMQQQRMLEAAAMQQQFATMGVRPGQAGGTDSSAANPGSQQEGVSNPEAPQSAT